MENDDVVANKRYNDESVTGGLVLKRFRQMSDDFVSQGTNLKQLQAFAKMAEVLHESVEEVKKAMDEIKIEEKRKQETVRETQLGYDDYRPDAWEEDDVNLQKKIGLYVGFLETSLKKTKKKLI